MNHQTPFVDSSGTDSSYNNILGVSYYQYPPPSLTRDVSAGLPYAASSMDGTSPWDIVNEYTYSSSSATFPPPQPPRSIHPGAIYTPTPTSASDLSDSSIHTGRSMTNFSQNQQPLGVQTLSPATPTASSFVGSTAAQSKRQRNGLNEGFARLRETLPASTSLKKASKVSVLDRATSHIKDLEAMKDHLEAQLKSADQELHRLRRVNEALMLNLANPSHHASQSTFTDRLSPSGNPGPRLISKKSPPQSAI